MDAQTPPIYEQPPALVQQLSEGQIDGYCGIPEDPAIFDIFRAGICYMGHPVEFLQDGLRFGANAVLDFIGYEAQPEEQEYTPLPSATATLDLATPTPGAPTEQPTQTPTPTIVVPTATEVPEKLAAVNSLIYVSSNFSDGPD